MAAANGILLAGSVLEGRPLEVVSACKHLHYRDLDVDSIYVTPTQHSRYSQRDTMGVLLQPFNISAE